MKYLGAITNDYDLVTKKYVDDAAKVIQTLTSGTAIGSVGGTTLYAPAGGSSVTTATATLTTAGWSGGTQTVSVTGVTANNTVIVSPAPASYTAYGSSGVYCSAQASGTLTFTCSSVPSAALTVNVLIL